jgi:hypothetical protein
MKVYRVYLSPPFEGDFEAVQAHAESLETRIGFYPRANLSGEKRL